MTAIVGTLNRRGVVFAADSAATFTTSTTRKISNTANKIFALSRKHPVGIAIYNNLDFYGVPWEIIFKRYRDYHLLDKCFPHIMDYINDFWEYLRSDILPKISREDQLERLSYFVLRLKNECIENAHKSLNDKKIAINDKTSFDEIVLFLETLKAQYRLHSRSSEFKDYDMHIFSSSCKGIISHELSDILTNHECPKELEQLFMDVVYEIITSDVVVYYLQTDLVFWGYGDDELFPSYHHYEITITIDQLIKYVAKDTYAVSNTATACVAPFAQTDVANTVVRGIDQKLRDEIAKIMFTSYDSFRNSLLDALKKANAPIDLQKALLSVNISEHIKSLTGILDKYIRENYVDKLLDIVAFLSKEDLAEMAESLVKMTCLKRHITTDEESVGGPVDVAVITKGDGFVWIKRKHYFLAELNHDFFKK